MYATVKWRSELCKPSFGQPFSYVINGMFVLGAKLLLCLCLCKFLQVAEQAVLILWCMACSKQRVCYRE